MADTGDRLEQAELRLAKAQEALDEVGKVLEAAEQARAAATKAHDAAERANAAIRKVYFALPALGVVLGIAVALSRRRQIAVNHHRTLWKLLFVPWKVFLLGPWRLLRRLRLAPN